MDKSGLMTLLMILLSRPGMAEKDSDKETSNDENIGRFIYLFAEKLKEEPELFPITIKIMTLSEKRWQIVVSTFMSKYPGRKYKS